MRRGWVSAGNSGSSSSCRSSPTFRAREGGFSRSSATSATRAPLEQLVHSTALRLRSIRRMRSQASLTIAPLAMGVSALASAEDNRLVVQPPGGPAQTVDRFRHLLRRHRGFKRSSGLPPGAGGKRPPEREKSDNRGSLSAPPEVSAVVNSEPPLNGRDASSVGSLISTGVRRYSFGLEGPPERNTRPSLTRLIGFTNLVLDSRLGSYRVSGIESGDRGSKRGG